MLIWILHYLELYSLNKMLWGFITSSKEVWKTTLETNSNASIGHLLYINIKLQARSEPNINWPNQNIHQLHWMLFGLEKFNQIVMRQYFLFSFWDCRVQFSSCFSCYKLLFEILLLFCHLNQSTHSPLASLNTFPPIKPLLTRYFLFFKPKT